MSSRSISVINPFLANPTCRRLGSSMHGSVGEEIELNHPDDPICILSSDGNEAEMPRGKLRRKVSFFSSPLGLNTNGESSLPKPSSRKGLPMIKIVNTSRSDMNGKLGYVHSYYRTRERYSVTLLEGGELHPALLYFGVIDAEDVKHMKFCRESEMQTNNDQGFHGTIFLPPTTVVHLNFLDIFSLFLQYVAWHILGSPPFARVIEKVMDTLINKVLPPMKLENFSMFFLLVLPVSLAKMYKILVDQWETLTAIGSSDLLGVIDASGVTLSLSNILASFSDHQGEYFTLSLLLIGTSVIARFTISEYRLVRDKADAMLCYQTGGNQGKKSFSKMEMFEYRIDYYFSTSKWAKVALLLSFTFMLIAVGAGLLVVFMDDHSISNAVWISWTYVADPGTHADCPESFLIRLISFTVTLGGMLIFALMIGIISDYIAEKVDDLKKGKSRIIDIDHTVMLGWNDKSLAIIQQVALANESEGGGTIVVLANIEKEEMEETLASAVESNENPLRLLGTEVIFRSGNPLLESELRRVSTQTARSVVSLTSEGTDPDEADATQVRQVMALKAFDEFVGSQCHVVIEVQDIDNQELFPLVAPDFAEVVVTHDIIGRLMIQCARCPGLASVLEEMMGFEGSEFYFEEWPELTGKTFYDITCRFNDAVPLGIKSSSDGKVYINPANDHMINEGDKILVLAEDNDSYEVNAGDFDTTSVGNVPKLMPDTKKVERIMFCGWRRDMADMIIQLDEYVEKGSELWLFNEVPAKERATLLKDKGNKEDLKLGNLRICNVVGNPIIRRDLNKMRAVDDFGKATGQEITLDQFDSILILADSVAIENGANMMSSDSRSLSSLLIIQDIQKKMYENKKKFDPNTPMPCSPISEILDSRTKSLLSVVNCKGYIMSNQIISSVIAQVSEEKDINIVLHEILTADGSETYIRSVSRYVDLENESELSFWDIALRARQLQEVAIGFKPENLDFKQAAHLIINPPDKSIVRKWAPGDMIMTFSED
mmetsp:Transcript_28414/g.60182  ORF Transcript_28414/g.60182 Transcript_28414/m.60182 type:complete len:1000 (+) Transcript_28414:244-3243(+)|eukprot:CAMPEP_0172546412 /NCGR_PEP_ID=MMETSP1067-20121228/16187_1 /TAXON_ID=265564 ORGANISM="Thalassiosira punctigera, Strain Tpunct2005C2" /NCGR_SAMPLE_ID=MMETSP1067 /ASSEMBLY_ACC=CAM_ASM_000444 /LENGTH=999 /DNA_ID=CAMNT_0013333339 /DNA_START=234 /DNA_END=3233 /DNA_ORIENTATION=-